MKKRFFTKQLENSTKSAWIVATLCSEKFDTELVLEKEKEIPRIPTFSILIVEIIGTNFEPKKHDDAYTSTL